MITQVNFLDAIRHGKWIRRRRNGRAVCVSDTPTHLYSITKADLLATDWEVHGEAESETSSMDDSQKRFSLLELDE